MVLDADHLNVLLERPPGREIVGMEVVGNELGPHTEHLQVELEVGPEGEVGRRRVEVAEVGREERLPASGDAEGALQLGAGGDQGAPAAMGSGIESGAKPRERRIEKLAATTESSQRRWIGRSWLRSASAIPSEPIPRIVIGEGDRLVGSIAARHHQRPAETVAEQVVERL